MPRESWVDAKVSPSGPSIVEGVGAPSSLPGRLLPHASHALKQHLHAINLYAGVLEARVGGPSVGAIVSGIRRSSEALAQTLDAIVDLCQIESGTLAVDKHPVAGRRIIESLKSTAPGAPLRLVDSGRMISADARLFGRVLGLLLGVVVDRSPQVVAGFRGAVPRFEIWFTGTSPSASDLEAARLAGDDAGRALPDLRLIIAARIAASVGIGLSLHARSAATSRLVVEIAEG